jgi:hypothetical protein
MGRTRYTYPQHTRQSIDHDTAQDSPASGGAICGV